MKSDDIKYTGNSTKPGNPLWDEYIDEYGRSTLSVHTPKKIMESCDGGNCYFSNPDGHGNVECRKCGRGLKIVWGMHVVKNGKIVKLKS